MKEIDGFVQENSLQIFGIITSSINDATKEFEKCLLLYQPTTKNIAQFFDEFCSFIEKSEFF